MSAQAAELHDTDDHRYMFCIKTMKGKQKEGGGGGEEEREEENNEVWV